MLVELDYSGFDAALETLDVVGHRLTDATLQLMATSRHVRALKYLTFVTTPFSAKAVSDFFASSEPHALVEVFFSLPQGVEWSSEGFSRVYEALLAFSGKDLKRVTLPKNPNRDEATWLALQRRFSISET